jgi:hypothetical protein
VNAKTYDVRCRAIARIFLGDCGSFSEDEVHTLASDVQQTIEDFIEARPSAVAMEPRPGHVSCYVCGRCVPEDAYFSDRRTDSGPVASLVALLLRGVDPYVWGDVALVLCESCATKGEAMPDAEAFAFYASGRHWTDEKKAPGRGRALDAAPSFSVISDDDARERFVSDVKTGALAYMAGYTAARNASPEPGSIEWVTAKLAGREFPEANSAREFLARALAGERIAISARAEQKPHARYKVTFTLELDDDDGSSETDVEGVVENILDEAMRSPEGADCVVRDDLRLYDVTNVSATFDEMVTP